MQRPPPPLSARAWLRRPHPFRIADFRFYWAARLASTIAQMGMMLVIGWQVYDIARADDGLEERALPSSA